MHGEKIVAITLKIRLREFRQTFNAEYTACHRRPAVTGCTNTGKQQINQGLYG
jgi:hypothetical protein